VRLHHKKNRGLGRPPARTCARCFRSEIAVPGSPADCRGRHSETRYRRQLRPVLGWDRQKLQNLRRDKSQTGLCRVPSPTEPVNPAVALLLFASKFSAFPVTVTMTRNGRSGLKFRTEKAVQGTKPCVHQFSRDTIGKGLPVAPPEVVTHFYFQLIPASAFSAYGSPRAIQTRRKSGRLLGDGQAQVRAHSRTRRGVRTW
jgi:hypothetical protein